MKKFITVFLLLFIFINSFGETPIAINQIESSDSTEYKIIVAEIIDVTTTAKNKYKSQTLCLEYLAKHGNEEIRLVTLNDIDMKDDDYNDVIIGESYVLVVNEIPSLKVEHENSELMNKVVPVNEYGERLWDLKSYKAYNLNFGKVIPFQEILFLQIPDNVPEPIKKLNLKMLDIFMDPIITQKSFKKNYPKELMDRLYYDINSKGKYGIQL